jgi:nitroimidazol reductase NimA-like FMN-containing flavoprotein (pyridoxamine 5'-phosphate oxidase superfamily)
MDLDRVARELIDRCPYMTLATADDSGRPWASPVYFAHDGYGDFLWVSYPDTTHSCNVAVRAQVGISIYDSHVPVGEGQGVYVAAQAAEVGESDRERLIGVYSRRSEEHVGRAWTVADVTAPAGLRLYRARAQEIWTLDPAAPRDVRVPVTPNRGAA